MITFRRGRGVTFPRSFTPVHPAPVEPRTALGRFVRTALRHRRIVLGILLLLALTALVAVASRTDGSATAAAPPAPTTSAERHNPSNSTVPTTVLSPEGAQRAGSQTDTAASPTPEPDALEHEPATDALVAALDSIPVRPEAPRAGYKQDLFKHWDDEDHDGCDTRCEVLASQRRRDGTWLSEWDGYITDDPSGLHIDHVVALAEAWDSGADQWTPQQRDEFADYLPNLLAVSAASNLRKSDRDAAEWFPSRSESNCL